MRQKLRKAEARAKKVLQFVYVASVASSCLNGFHPNVLHSFRRQKKNMKNQVLLVPLSLENDMSNLQIQIHMGRSCCRFLPILLVSFVVLFLFLLFQTLTAKKHLEIAQRVFFFLLKSLININLPHVSIALFRLKTHYWKLQST